MVFVGGNGSYIDEYAGTEEGQYEPQCAHGARLW